MKASDDNVSSSPGHSGATPARIIIVDDEAPNVDALGEALRTQGFDTVGFTSGLAALDALRASKFELLLTDLNMPGMDGITLLRAATELDRELAGIMMTGQGTIDTAVEAMKAGALDYILKPFKLGPVVAVVTRALGIRKLRLENEALHRRVRERTEELEVANKELEAFSFSVSHDLRSPLTAIHGFAELVLRFHRAELSGEVLDHVDNIHRATTRMRGLIDDLLEFSRLGRQAVVKKTLSMAALVHDVAEEQLRLVPNRRPEIRVGELPDAIGDPSLLRQVLGNLLSNAFKFTGSRDGALVEVGFREQAGEGAYFVRDNGAGFDMQYAEKLFGVFQRLHRQDEFEGTGVGLSIVQRIIERHGGRVWAEGEVGKGATFFFSLP